MRKEDIVPTYSRTSLMLLRGLRFLLHFGWTGIVAKSVSTERAVQEWQAMLHFLARVLTPEARALLPAAVLAFDLCPDCGIIPPASEAAAEVVPEANPYPPSEKKKAPR
jgi:hypothetical protein